MDAGQPSQQVAGGTETFMPPGFPPVLSPSVPAQSLPNLTEFGVGAGDPVKVALECATANGGIRVPFICAANSLLPGGRYLDFGPTYEQEFCNRSNLWDTLTRKWPGMNDVSLYPISATGGIFSDRVAVYLGPREDNYEYLDPIPDLPVILVPPVRKPIVKGNGSLYQFREDDSTMRSKICGALRICLHNNYDRVVIGDFGLGDGNHNPPQAVAEIWRDLLLFDPNLRGQFQYVVFAFPDPTQNTTELHRDAHEREVGAAHETRWHDTTARIVTSSMIVDLPIRTPAPTDVEIFESVFHIDEIKRVCEEAAGRFELINRQMLS